MKWSSGFPHSYGGRYASRNASHFLYDWDQRNGLIAFLYDPSADLSGQPPSFVHAGPTAFYRKSGPALLACG
jgi:hypothetical protein